MSHFILIFSIIFFCQTVLASEGADVFLSKSASGEWKVKFTVSEPTKRLAFIRNPNDARTKRWKPLSDDFIIEYLEGKEFIKRKDGAKFSSSSFLLTPTYIPLPKDYAPFANFSDDGTLVYDGRFFACSNECDHDIDYLWNFELSAPRADNILVNEMVTKNKAVWKSRDSGTNVYVGKQKLDTTSDLITLIDVGLPSEIKASLSLNLPKIMDYFIDKFSHLDQKHSLFASYKKTSQEGVGSQGGVLPNQVFMHWYGRDLEKAVKKDIFLKGTVWFFAHEVAHMYQKKTSQTKNDSEAWLHEGAADKFAMEAMLFVEPDSTIYIEKRIEEFKQSCEKGIQGFSLSKATEKGQFGLHYSCGFLIHHSIDIITKKRFPDGDGIFDIWREYQQRVKDGAEANQETYLKIVGEYTSEPHKVLIENFIADSKSNYSALIDSYETLK